ncbi:MAG: dihydrolipoyl dehydrogenase [Deltaproteobacteria bacterium]|nr:dihydrolipoyl dehydrogenase [Deltaproteobacteria bacterium]MBM4351178.1 dihydrolipoyl dehydrogenase [Deltaproteobacteria bacterium]
MNPKRIVIIGGGPGGYVAAIRAAQLGAKPILIEKDKIGGTCLNRGCIPTKALLHDAKLLHSLKGSPVFQLLSFDTSGLLNPMMERKKKVVEELVKGVEILLESHRVTIKHGQADLLNPNQVVLLNGEKEIIDADTIILAPGSKSKGLPNITPDSNRIITSDEALEITQIPREMVIIGGGYIGVEFATLFNTLGSRVTIVEILENILPGLEGELVRNLRRFLERDGVKILTQSSVEEIQYGENGLRLGVKTPQGIQEVIAEKLLMAVGRGPNLELSFSKAGIEISPKGIKVSRRMETTAPGIYAIGDAIEGIMLAHVAMEQGMVAAENAMGLHREWESPWIPLCIFSHPEVASIGLTEKEAKAKGEIKIGRFPFRSNPKAVISGETDGLIKVIASRENGTLLGVHIIGPEATVIISIASTMIGAKLNEFARLIQAHPTIPEGLKEACLDADGLAIHLPKPLRPPKSA